MSEQRKSSRCGIARLVNGNGGIWGDAIVGVENRQIAHLAGRAGDHGSPRAAVADHCFIDARALEVDVVLQRDLLVVVAGRYLDNDFVRRRRRQRGSGSIDRSLDARVIATACRNRDDACGLERIAEPMHEQRHARAGYRADTAAVWGE